MWGNQEKYCVQQTLRVEVGQALAPHHHLLLIFATWKIMRGFNLSCRLCFLSKKHSCYAAAAAPRFIGQKKRMKMMLFLLPSSSSLSASLPPRKIAWKSLSCNATSVTPSSFAIKKGLVAEKAHCILFLEKCVVHLPELLNVGHTLYSSSNAWWKLAINPIF